MPNDYDIGSPGATLSAALAGLLASRKTLPPALFYDEEGCRIFYKITKLPEYYLTRTEFALLNSIAPDVAKLVPPGATLVEYGASDETKAAVLLRAAPFRYYVPVDVAGPALDDLRHRMELAWTGVTVLPVTADFMQPVMLPSRPDETAVTGFFPGSTIGNLRPDEAVTFLRRARLGLGSEARFLLGFDTCQDEARLLPAYDDPAGVTAAFNLNLLVRLNREACAGFDLSRWAHRAVWNGAEHRIEMHLVSLGRQTIRVAGHAIHFADGETIHTENSYKYPPERMRELIESAGWRCWRTWTDPEGLFALWLLDQG